MSIGAGIAIAGIWIGAALAIWGSPYEALVIIIGASVVTTAIAGISAKEDKKR